MALRKQAFSGKNLQLLCEWYIALYYVPLQDIFLDFEITNYTLILLK